MQHSATISWTDPDPPARWGGFVGGMFTTLAMMIASIILLCNAGMRIEFDRPPAENATVAPPRVESSGGVLGPPPNNPLP